MFFRNTNRVLDALTSLRKHDTQIFILLIHFVQCAVTLVNLICEDSHKVPFNKVVFKF